MINMHKHNRYLMLVSFLSLFCLLISSCNRGQPEKGDNHIWFENEQGNITTNDLPRLQKLVPFDILLPEYLPDDIDESGVTFRLATKKYDFEYKIVTIEYYTANYSKVIDIDEQENPKELSVNLYDDPTSENDLNIIINDTTIWEDGLSRPYNGLYRYSWLHEGMWFHAYIDGYNQDESRKIIESMIR